MKNIKFSLILCTVGDFKFIENLFESLCDQEYKNFEVVLVDQNEDSRLDNLLESYKNRLELVHLKSERGLSIARNVGIQAAKGDIFSFPDDDCTYPKELLNKVNLFFKDTNYSGLVIRAKNSVPGGRVLHENDPSQELTRGNCLSLVHSISLFLTRDIVESVGDFDIHLGLGANTIFQGQEDRDYPIRALDAGFQIYYKNDITVLHPWDDPEIDEQKNLIARAFKGGASEMYLLNKHNFGITFKISRVIRKIMAITYFAIYKRNLYKMRSSLSGLKGMVRYFNTKTLP
ncbi:glycosyltransferase family 2 protein [Vibrio ulleungensis]|uniref:Glycosyltransferase family 2 protein n=1 Tax=Vibrio ulleungensis TaxID=2807619 RepID=A0ABS2HJL3_9VIBR|nr:glycosyltransferase family 2 protein [Vibrio ulleungensis]MBM7037695.1 glycosyltransferase family 2 protein [Vibrio ulleungensis]